MNREEQIQDAALNDFSWEDLQCKWAFIHGARWADEHPKQKPVKWSEEDKKMVDRLIRCCEKEYEELCNDRYGHQEIISDLKQSCRERWDWLESLKKRMEEQQ